MGEKQVEIEIVIPREVKKVSPLGLPVIYFLDFPWKNILISICFSPTCFPLLDKNLLLALFITDDGTKMSRNVSFILTSFMSLHRI